MNIIDRFRMWVGRGMVKAIGIQLVPPFLRHSYMVPTFRAMAQEGYKGNGAVFGCISALAFAFPEPPLLVWEETAGGKSPMRAHPLSQLLKRPNSQMGLDELMQYTIVYMAVGGNCYWYKVRSRAGRVVELWPLHDGQINPVAGGDKLVDYYEYDDGSGTLQNIDAKDIIHFKWQPDPLQPWRGLSPLVAVAREVDTDNEATRYLFSLLKNDALPRLAITVPETHVIEEDERKRLKADWAQSHGGDQRGGVALLEGGLDVKTIALNLRELEFNVLRRVPEARMTAAFRVPPIIAGLNVGLENATYSNFKEAGLLFTERTLVPLWGKMDDKLTSDLLPEFAGAPNQVVECDYDRVVVLAEKKMAMRQWAADALGRGGITVNEFRSVYSLPLDAGGNVYLRGMAVTDVPFTPVAGQGKTAAGKAPDTPAPDTKAKRNKRTQQKAVIAGLRQVRQDTAAKMEKAVDKWFGDWADRVVSRAQGKATVLTTETKAGLPTADDLLTPDDDAEFKTLLEKFYISLLETSWEWYDLALGGLNTPFDPEDPAVTAVLATAGERIKAINETTLERMRDVLQRGSERGWSIDHIVRGDPDLGVMGLRDVVLEAYKGRARTICRTELGNAQNMAAWGRYSAAGVAKVYVMDNGLDDDDSKCQDVNNTVQTMQWAQDNPLEHPNCVIGSTEVVAQDVLAAYLREFHGEVIVLHTATDQHLTCTPNHPILTRQGWVPAGKLRKGDQVISCLDSQRMARLLNPDNDQVPTTIENMVRTLLETRGVTSRVVPGSAEDFHGDGVEGQVCVVDVDGLLGDGHNAANGKPIGQLSFGTRDKGVGSGLVIRSASEQCGSRLLGAADGRMGSGSVGHALLERTSDGCSDLGFLETAHLKATAAKCGSQRTSADANLAGQDSSAFSCQVPAMYREIVVFLSKTDGEAALGEPVSELPSSQPNFAGQFIEQFASLVASEELIEVERKPFSGHVYNISTRQGWFIADGIVTHNCTRAFAPEFD